MNEQLLAEFLDDRNRLNDQHFAELLSVLRTDLALAEMLRQSLMMDDLLSRTLGSSRGDFVAQVAMRIRDIGKLPADRHNAMRQSLSRKELPPSQNVAVLSLKRKWWTNRSGWVLAAAATFAIVAGGVWFGLRTVGAAEPLGLRVAEASGEWSVVSGQWSVGGGENIHHAPSTIHPSSETRAMVGMELRQGERVVVKDGGKVGLKYDGEATTIELLAATEAAFGSEKGAKRVRLDGGSLVCTAAPQKMPFQIETPHAVAEIVGTRFSLHVTDVGTTLAVQEGKVALRQKDKSLEVSAGETAAADAAGLRKLSPADAWLKELLARAEAGTWDAADFGKGAWAVGDWRLDGRGTPAERLIWNVHADPQQGSGIYFDAARYKRAVVTGRLMLLADGQRPPETPDHAQAAVPPQWYVYNARMSAERNRTFALTLYQGAREDGCGAYMENFPTPISHAGAWCRFAIYFDTEVEGRRPLMISVCWLETDAGPPPAGEWGHDESTNPQWRAGHPLGFGLFAYNCRIQVSALKLVPLGPDLPQAPVGLGGRGK